MEMVTCIHCTTNEITAVHTYISNWVLKKILIIYNSWKLMKLSNIRLEKPCTIYHKMPNTCINWQY